MTDAPRSASFRLRPVLGSALLPLALLGSLAGCGRSTHTAGGDDPESPYCRVARDWAVHELTPFDDRDPVATRTYFHAYQTFVREAARSAPPSLEGAWATNARAVDSLLLPVVEKYGFSIERLQAEGSAEEIALTDEPPVDVAAAQDVILAYEAKVCGTAQPPAADVAFHEAPSSAYCDASNAIDGAFDAIANSGFDPDAIRHFITSDRYHRLARAAEEAAPAVIKGDVVTLSRFDVDQTFPLVAKYDYDVRRLMLEGSASERAIFQSWDPRVHDSFARLEAYDQQYCASSEAP